jgi:hypothetical protein
MDRYVPGMAAWVEEAVDLACAEDAWAEWTVKTIQYDASASIRVTDMCAQVIATSGPVVLLQPVQDKVVQLLRERLNQRVSVLFGTAYTTDEVFNFLAEAKRLHETGEPHIPRALVVALLLLRKLEREHMWGGKNKGYMWAGDIPKGRGLDEQFADEVPRSLGLLFQEGLLIQKPSQTSNKYALNPDRREEIYAILRERRFGERLARILGRDTALVSARELDLLDDYGAPTR